ncbi:MAG: NADH-ubiquinone oxidoreductase-F iron-sulfur binding region domain-containing protein, partial [Acidimicrobiales bacterium]
RRRRRRRLSRAEPPVPGFLLPAEPVTSVDGWRALGGGEGLSLARAKGPDWVIEEVNRSGLRGRGGGGFRTGRKWAGVRAQSGTHRYVVCNAAEGEPATFKDRALLRANPYQLVEGVAIAAFALAARHAYIGIKASFEWEVLALESALAEMGEAGLAGDVPITLVPGPDEYLFGEEKAMLEVVEGRPPMPRLLAPYEHGLFAVAPQIGWEGSTAEPGHPARERDESNPTLVNNCETLSNVPHILAWGADWFREMGTEESPGTLVTTVVGDVARPGYAEVEMGTPLRRVLDEVGGGARPGRTLKAVFSGVANAVLTTDRFDTPLSYEAMAAAASGLGAAGYAVYDDTACMVAVAQEFSKFLFVESCGQCPPCKLNSEEITNRLAAIDGCRGGDDDIAVIGARLLKVTDGNRCYLPVEEQIVVSSILRAFPEEFAAHVEGDCPRHRPDVLVPKIVDLRDGEVVYDEKQARKRPDWTYA